MLYCIKATDSRLAVLGVMISVGLYLLFWAYRTWRASPRNLVAMAVLVAYPVMFMLAIASSFTVDAVRIRVWGGGAAQYSTEARKIQYGLGVPKVIQRPWGWGMGSGGRVLGYIDNNGLASIDSYYLSAALEYGVIGLIAFFTMTIGVIYLLARALPYAHDSETELIGPLLISMVNFLIIKSVLSAQENHSYVYILLGMSLVLIERVQRQRREAAAKS
nr:O-antigen ligase family protein [Sphingomonas sp. BGYR3]